MLYDSEQLYREMSFIAYYFHWGNKDLLTLDHFTRRRWCEEISHINSSLNPSENKKEKSIFDLGKA